VNSLNIKISNDIRDNLPHFHVAVIEATIQTTKTTALDECIASLQTRLKQTIDIKEVIHLDVIKDGRDGYKTLGKDPSRYRLAVESLYRRLVKGNKLYRINDIVDIGNVISIETRKSVAMLDKDQIKGDVLIRLGTKSDAFEGIGRGPLNVENIPVYEDDLGPFGSTTSDTDRTKITNQTTSLLMFIISFSKETSLQDDIALTKSYFEKYLDFDRFKSSIV
jgi:DNA/RNA-binding domain of Phe-tRNA-synthetase-like protein